MSTEKRARKIHDQHPEVSAWLAEHLVERASILMREHEPVPLIRWINRADADGYLEIPAEWSVTGEPVRAFFESLADYRKVIDRIREYVAARVRAAPADYDHMGFCFTPDGEPDHGPISYGYVAEADCMRDPQHRWRYRISHVQHGQSARDDDQTGLLFPDEAQA